MRIQQLILENFRGFEKLEMDFPEGESGLVVLVGVNGSGKTSVLEGIAYLLNGFISDLHEGRMKNTEPSEEQNPIVLHGHDVKNGTTEGKLKINFEYLGENTGNHRKLTFEGFSIRTSGELKKKKLEHLRKKLNNVLWLQAPIFSFLPTDRTVSKPELNILDLKNHQSQNIYDELLNQSINFKRFFDWFRSVEDVESEQIRFQKNIDHRDKKLNAVREAIQSFLPNYTNFRVQRQPEEDFILDKNENQLSISSLSHGEKLALVLFGDIARKLSTANPHLENPIEGKGIVLIDEIELHLHPSWQRKIIPALRRTFPNVQFIVTTHSPQVISTVPKENVFILEDFKLVEKTPFTKGRDSNSLLFDIFGVQKRPKEAEDEFRQLYKLIDDPEVVKATEKMLSDVEEKYGYYDPEVVRARAFFEDLNNL